MNGHRIEGRRLTGTHITVIVVAVALLATPAVGYASYTAANAIVDPYNSSAFARVTEDGRLGTRGEATTQTGVPSNAWDSWIRVGIPEGGRTVLKWTRSRGIGVSQISWWTNDARGRTAVFFRLWAQHADSCSVHPDDIMSAHLLYETYFTKPQDDRYASEQVTFPVPLATHSNSNLICLIVEADRAFGVSASGVEGPPTATFSPAKGTPPADQGDAQGHSNAHFGSG